MDVTEITEGGLTNGAQAQDTGERILPELDKPAPFVRKLKIVTEVHGPITSPGRPSEYNGEKTCKLAKNMAKAGLSHTMMAATCKLFSDADLH